VTSPTRSPSDPPRGGRWLRRFGGAVVATTAGGVLLAGAPVTPSAQTPAPAVADDLQRVSAATARWPGHPGRTLVRHRVRPGETATGLAVRFHAWTAELRRLNHLRGAGHLVTGRVVTIPVVDAAVPRRRHERTTASKHPSKRHRARSARVVRHPWRQASASRADVRRLVVRTAHRYGVDPHLALAISWQESGWQQRRTSSAGAVGAMQIMPGTGRWMSLYVDRPLNIYSLRDNVTAGVVLFKVLRSQASWRHSIAAYYQGLGAVQEHGLYPSTRVYTRSVSSLYRRIHRGWRPA
jgi:hypothetical protein